MNTIQIIKMNLVETEIFNVIRAALLNIKEFFPTLLNTDLWDFLGVSKNLRLLHFWGKQVKKISCFGLLDPDDEGDKIQETSVNL